MHEEPSLYGRNEHSEEFEPTTESFSSPTRLAAHSQITAAVLEQA